MDSVIPETPVVVEDPPGFLKAELCGDFQADFHDPLGVQTLFDLDISVRKILDLVEVKIQLIEHVISQLIKWVPRVFSLAVGANTEIQVIQTHVSEGVLLILVLESLASSALLLESVPLLAQHLL